MFNFDGDSIIRKGHPLFFGLIIVSCIIEMSISAWVTSQYISRHNSPDSGTETRVRFILFTSVWTIVISLAYSLIFQLWMYEPFAGTLSHLIFLMLTWIFWLAAAASITTDLGGTLNCTTQDYFEYCGQLNAMLGFSWLIGLLVTLALIFILLCGIRSARRGDGYFGSLVAWVTNCFCICSFCCVWRFYDHWFR